MTWGMVAVAGSTLVSSAIGSRSASKAADAQAGASDRATAEQRAMYDQTREDNMPALGARNSSLARVQEMLGIGGNAKAAGYGSWSKPIAPQNVQNEAGYQFGLQQGNNNIQGSAAAAGGLFSGATGKALTRYGNDYATTKYGDAYNRLAADQDRSRNALMQLAGAGQSGASTIGQSGNYMAGQIGSNMIGAGNARGASIIAQGNALQSGVNALGYGLSNGGAFKQSAQPGYSGVQGVNEWWA